MAVGGTNGYFPDGKENVTANIVLGYGKPWSNEDPNAVDAFWNAEAEWYPTWDGENAALQVDYIKVSQ